jgi:hypothetical protein
MTAGVLICGWAGLGTAVEYFESARRPTLVTVATTS